MFCRWSLSEVTSIVSRALDYAMTFVHTFQLFLSGFCCLGFLNDSLYSVCDVSPLDIPGTRALPYSALQISLTHIAPTKSLQQLNLLSSFSVRSCDSAISIRLISFVRSFSWINVSTLYMVDWISSRYLQTAGINLDGIHGRGVIVFSDRKGHSCLILVPH